MNVIEAKILRNSKINNLKLGSFRSGTYEHPLINVYCNKKSFIHGFGGAITYTTAYNYSLLNKTDKKKFLDSLVTPKGLNYSLFRLTIGSTDFSLKPYSYAKDKDFKLSSFSIAEDKKYIIPLIKDMMKEAPHKLRFIASPWSPPAFMKSNNDLLHGGHLLPIYYDLYAEYIIKYLKAYEKEGIHIESLTLQNEAKASQTWESCTFTKEQEVAFAKVLHRHLLKHKLNVKLFAWDHNKERLVERATYILKKAPFLSGLAFHFYSGDHFDAISLVKSLFPNKEFIETEFCVSHIVDETKASYAHEIINSLRSGANAIIDWNILTDYKGGPFHDRKSKESGCDAVMRLDKNNHLVFTPLYYEMYMFSHFIESESHSLWTSSFDESLKVNAIKNKKNVVINIHNKDLDETIKLFYKNKFLDIKLEPNSLITLVVR